MALWSRLSNKFQWNEPGLELNVSGGLYYLSAIDQPDFSYSAEIRKQWQKVGNVSLSGARSPYFTTLESISEPVYFDQYELKLDRPYDLTLNGEFAVRHRIFEDGNVGWNIYGYLMYSIIESQDFRLKIGYGFNYDDMQSPRFLPVRSLEEILESPEDPIVGRYDPYFTPEEQRAQSALMNINWDIRSWLSLSGSASISVFAKSEIPYLFLSRDDEGEITIARSFQETDEQLMEYQLGISCKPLPSLTLSLEGRYQELFFYRNRGLRLALTMQL